jgi:hypothetical protein
VREHNAYQDRIFLPAADDGPSLRWLKIHARYIRVLMDSRALVSVWLPGDRHLAVNQVLALPDGSVALQGTLEDGTVLHVSRRSEDLVLEMHPAPEGVDCTGFAFMGISRTPQPFLDRLKTAPPQPSEQGEMGEPMHPPHGGADPPHGHPHAFVSATLASGEQ